MKTQSIAALAVVVGLSLTSSWSVAAQLPQPLEMPPPKGRPDFPLGRPHEAGPLVRFPISIDPMSQSANAPEIGIGQPGVSYRYVQTFGSTERA